MTNSTTTPPRGSGPPPGAGTSGHLPVNGLNMYYEVHGEGRPLVLLHGELTTIGTSFGSILPLLAGNHRVVAVEQQAHGHTADIERPLTYEQLADDTAAALRHLSVRDADILGFGMGSGIAVCLAIRHPELVRKLVLATPAYDRDGFHPGVVEDMAALSPEHLAGSAFEEDYLRTAPRPQDWPVLIERVKRLNLEFVGWPEEAVAAIRAPALIVVGDSDVVRPEHALSMFRLLGGGVAGDVAGLPSSQLAVLPGTGHLALMERAEWLTPMVEAFLETPVRAKP
ncbi:Pimeloyl-ACP methyl ester carboxylesterase [Actinopolymorpha cephalotaxi]|uniref:Pimeloyl-ACP methyl ester carboxylesterase n=1 Tax=Actinopolymorpha cephalotaxi TaxID=504797 RepID=A0A1I2M3Q0_9ACTN|nr:alpha/beta hydrolase [Actinopolymorpha cephalotaxi]NYH81570.1 pimeloyl-ACP methyl ester carboxylesterase [Actinopolymorpha cephalotaxi]SFF86075.1 Pimeloyl-ACP methyl ester carboxylesterase [Actinopolymorpha cephalotaxi]